MEEIENWLPKKQPFEVLKMMGFKKTSNIDMMTQKLGHTVLRLLPYHYAFSLIKISRD